MDRLNGFTAGNLCREMMVAGKRCISWWAREMCCSPNDRLRHFIHHIITTFRLGCQLVEKVLFNMQMEDAKVFSILSGQMIIAVVVLDVVAVVFYKIIIIIIILIIIINIKIMQKRIIVIFFFLNH